MTKKSKKETYYTITPPLSPNLTLEDAIIEAWGKMLPKRLAEMDREDLKQKVKIIKLNTHLKDKL